MIFSVKLYPSYLVSKKLSPIAVTLGVEADFDFDFVDELETVFSGVGASVVDDSLSLSTTRFLVAEVEVEADLGLVFSGVEDDFDFVESFSGVESPGSLSSNRAKVLSSLVTTCTTLWSVDEVVVVMTWTN